MSHANAPLTPKGRRRLASLIIDNHWPIRRAAERFQVSPATASKWAARYHANESLDDRSSRPQHCPTRLCRKRKHRIISLRFNRQWGPHRISYHLGIPRSTVERVLTRYRMPKLAHLDQATGLPVRKPISVRYEKQAPGELVHVDIKKLGRIPEGGGWRADGRGSVQDRQASNARNRAARQGAAASRGYLFLHHAVDDYSRLAYLRDPQRREEGNRGRVLGTSPRFLRSSGHRGDRGDDR